MARSVVFTLLFVVSTQVASAFLAVPAAWRLSAGIQLKQLPLCRGLDVRHVACARVALPALRMTASNDGEKPDAEIGDKESDAKTDALMDILDDEADEAAVMKLYGLASEAEVAADLADDDDEGSFRKRRAEKKRKASGGQVSSELRFKLLEEQASPFRRFRQFFYIAAAGSASIGTFIAGTRVIAGMQGISGVQPLAETVPNTAINAGVVVVSGALWYFDEKRGQEALSTLKDKSSIRLGMSTLEVMDSDGTLAEMGKYRDEERLVILAGTAAEVTRAINLAARQANDLAKNDVSVIPYFTDLEDDSSGWNAMKESSSTGKWDTWLLRPQNKDKWKEWLLNDKAMVAEKNSKANKKSGTSGTKAAPESSDSFDRLLRVFVIRKDGKVGARTVGPPAWPKLIKQIEMLPQQDQYGRP